MSGVVLEGVEQGDVPFPRIGVACDRVAVRARIEGEAVADGKDTEIDARVVVRFIVDPVIEDVLEGVVGHHEVHGIAVDPDTGVQVPEGAVAYLDVPDLPDAGGRLVCAFPVEDQVFHRHVGRGDPDHVEVCSGRTDDDPVVGSLDVQPLVHLEVFHVGAGFNLDGIPGVCAVDCVLDGFSVLDGPGRGRRRCRRKCQQDGQAGKNESEGLQA